MKILIYTVAFRNKSNIVKLLSNFQNLRISHDLLIINNSPTKVNLNNQKKKIKIINNFKNIFYVGAFNQAISYAEKKKYSHLIHVNDDIHIFNNIFSKIIKNYKFRNSFISPTQCDSKNKIISNGSKINLMLGNTVWEINNKKSSVKGFCPQGSFFSFPIKFCRGFRIPQTLNNYCEETYLGYFFKKKFESYFLTRQKFIHYGANKKKNFNYKSFYITRNNILILKKFSQRNKTLIFKLYIYIFRSILNSFYKILFNPSYSRSILKGIHSGIKENL